MKMNRDQLVVKIASDIVSYGDTSPQAQLSLLQDLIIELLPQVEHGSPQYWQLMSVRCHKPAENVTDWLTSLMSVYLEFPLVQATKAALPREALITPY
jgi:hypothetical protein